MMWLNALHSFSEDLPGRRDLRQISIIQYPLFHIDPIVVSWLLVFQTSCMASKPSKARSSRSWNRCSPLGLSDLSGAENVA